MAVTQPYPRISDQKSKELGLLDVNQFKPLEKKITEDTMNSLIESAIKSAEIKTNKKALEITDNMSAAEKSSIYKEAAKSLFKYFKRPDPAGIANYLHGKNYVEVANEFIKKRKTHLESMNAGWRYQYLFVECAHASERFKSVSDLSTADSDVNIIAKTTKDENINLYISIKNRKDTISGGSGKGVLKKLEDLALQDKNRIGAYCCIIALGIQTMKHRGRTTHSANIEYWPANFFWPFISGYTYEEIMNMVTARLSTIKKIDLKVPVEIIEEFGELCAKNKIVNSQGNFDSKEAIIKWLCK